MKPKLFKRFYDIVITVSLWAYFTLGFMVFFSVSYFAALWHGDRETKFQKLNHLFFRFFFLFLQLIAPHIRFQIDKDAMSVRSSVIICNHVSYLDPLLMISLFERNKTIVKSLLFKIPIFGAVLRLSGYIPSESRGKFDLILIRQMEKMSDFLAAGGNIFIFPEGTRSRSGHIRRFNKSAFKIARQCCAPVIVFMIQDTDRLFTPGKFLFNTLVNSTITLKMIADIRPDYEREGFSVSDLTDQVYNLLHDRMSVVIKSGQTSKSEKI